MSLQTVIRMALEDAALLPAAIGGLEMHGTGTPLGDPIEVGAAAEVLAAARAGSPLQLGDVRSKTRPGDILALWPTVRAGNNRASDGVYQLPAIYFDTPAMDSWQ